MTTKAMNFDDLVRWATQYIHLGLLEKGGPGMQGAVHNALNQAIIWHIEQEKNKKVA
jgi:hypothetical protein